MLSRRALAREIRKQHFYALPRRRFLSSADRRRHRIYGVGFGGVDNAHKPRPMIHFFIYLKSFRFHIS